MHKVKLEHDGILGQVATYEGGGCISMDNASKRHLVMPQPCAQKVKGIKCIRREWEAEIKRSDDPVKEEGHLRAVVAALDTLKRGTYGAGRRRR